MEHAVWTGPGTGGHPDAMDSRERLVTVLEDARRSGALGPGPVADHIEHAAGFVHALEDIHGPVLDLGSGGGVPGLVIAEARPDLELTLVDAQARRVAFLIEAIATLELSDRVRALHGRAEELAHLDAHRGVYAAVTARSFGPPGVVAECGVGFLRPHGVLLVSEPPATPDRWPRDGLAVFGLTALGAVKGVQRLQASEPCDDRVPRRPGIPAKRPRF